MNNLRAAVRSLRSTPGPTLVVIATLAIALGANTAIFSVVEGVLLRPLGYGDDARLLVLWAASTSAPDQVFRLSPADYRDLRDGVGSFGGQVALYRMTGSTLTGLDEPARIGTMSVTPRLFSVLEAEPALGQLLSDEDERPGGDRKVVITHASWTRRFGADPTIVGSSIELDGNPYTVAGVTEPGFRFPPGDDEVEAYFAMQLDDSVLLIRDHRMFDAVARLAGGATLDAAHAELAALAVQLAREYPDTNEGWSLVARPVREELLGDLGTTLRVLAGAVFLVLLIACANVANVLLARSGAARRELAVRAALGARAGDLFRRSFLESVTLALIGGAGGMMLSFSGVSLLRMLLPAAIPRAASIGVDAGVLAFAAALSVGSAVAFGLLPALRSMRPDLAELLKPAGAAAGGPGGGRRLRELMVVVEVALAIVLLVGAGLLVRSFARLSEVDPGFRREGLASVAVRLPGSRYGRAEWPLFFEGLVERVRRLPGVRAAGAVSDLPMSDVGLDLELEFTVVGLDAASPTAHPNAEFRLVVPGYFEAMDMDIVRGRAFDGLDATSARPRVIINETLAERYFATVDPIGETVSVAMLGDVEIVGVVSDIHHRGLTSKYESEIYIPYGRLATAEMHVVVQSDLATAAVASAVGELLADLDPQLVPSQVVALSELLWESVAQPRFNAALLSGLALCAALLAAVGTYGIVAYSVSRRTSEIGVRMALGADSIATLTMILREALGVVLVGAIVGIAGALGATRFLRQLLFEVQPNDPLTYGVVFVSALLVALVAAWIPARRATRIDPVAALRDQ